MSTHNISLTGRFDEFVNEQISCGRYCNVSEVMRAGLRLLEQQAQEEKQKLALLRKLASKGFNQLDQGQGIELQGVGEIENYISRIGQRAAKRVSRRSNGA